MSIVWYTGIVVNGLLVLSFSYFILMVVRLYLHTQHNELQRKRLAVTIGLIGTFSVNLSLLFLYLQMGIIQHDALANETSWPLLFLIGYHVTLLSISLLIWLECYPKNKAGLFLLLCQFVVSLTAIAISSDYIVFWNDGAVLVALGATCDTITLWLGFVVGMVLLYSSFVKRMDETPNNVSSRSPKFLLVALINFAQFLVPRAETGSIVDSFSVKLIGFLVTIGFGYALYLYARTEEPTTEEFPDNQEHQTLGPSLKHLSVVAIFVILFNIAIQIQPEYGIEWREYLQSQSLFVGVWFNTNLYFNYIAVIIPLSCLILSVIVSKITPEYKQVSLDKQAYSWLLITGIFKISFFLIIHSSYLQSSSSISQSDGQTIIPFIISPIIAGIILELIGNKKTNNSFSHANDRPAQTIRIICLFGVTLLVALFADVIVALPPFSEPMNYVFIGAAGLVDGLLWAPLMSVIAYETILSLREIL